jgi:hypothetical protein
MKSPILLGFCVVACLAQIAVGCRAMQQHASILTRFDTRNPVSFTGTFRRSTMATKAFQIGQECRPTHSRMPKSRKLRPMSPVEAERFHPGQLRQARMLMVQLELMPTAKKTTPGHCG